MPRLTGVVAGHGDRSRPFGVRGLATLLLLLALGGCGGMKIEDFAGTTPRFVPEQYFLGKTRAWGIFQDRFGKVRRQMVVDIDGRVEGETLILDESFRYSDGETEQRTWRLTKVAPDRYEGTANGVVGTAVARTAGQAMNLVYDFDLKVGESIWRVHFDDWIWEQEDGVLVNRTTVSKWGFTLGEVSLFFKKVPGSAADAEPAMHYTQKAAE